MPILSVRRMVKRGSAVCFEDMGGFIIDRETRTVIRFYEFEGVYFVKLKVHDPATFKHLLEPDEGDKVDPAPFGRPGR